MNILIKIGIMPILCIIFMIAFIAYVVGDKKYASQLHAQAKVFAKEGVTAENIPKK